MDMAQQAHAVRIDVPFYQPGAGCGLHRYLDPDFTNRFKQDVERRLFGGPQFRVWQEDERHSRHGKEPVLRLPLHRAFHVVSCEVVCDRVGSPAFDPQRITSAGFVIRRAGGPRPQAWMLEDGEAVGWQEAPTDQRDPDVHRRLRARGVLNGGGQGAFSGEQVHPLHVHNTRDASGKVHTLLYGYLPLGGFYYERGDASPFDPASAREVEEAAAQSLSWPMGFRVPPGHSGDRTWLPEHARPVTGGRPSLAMFELLRLLVNRYHLGERELPENEALEEHCRSLWFHDVGNLPASLRDAGYDEGNHQLYLPFRRLDLYSYLQACFARGENNPLVRWIVEQERTVERAGELNQTPGLAALPASSGQEALDLTLFMLASDAQELRSLLDQRLRNQQLAQVKEIPLPKFTQGAGDVYQVVPFVRYRDCHGCEKVQWAETGARSIVFRVAAPFDPEASRPSLIQMPSLADLKRGLARGASLITPADTFKLMNSLKFNKGIGPDALPDKPPASGLDVQWICSFSLPVITLVAMLLLMIMISLLNIIFFWLPWVRICLPFPKMK